MDNTYLVVTNKHSWGAGTTEQEAIKNATANASSYNKSSPFQFSVYHFPEELVKDFGVDGMGGVNWKWADEFFANSSEATRDIVTKALRLGKFEQRSAGRGKVVRLEG